MTTDQSQTRVERLKQKQRELLVELQETDDPAESTELEWQIEVLKAQINYAEERLNA